MKMTISLVLTIINRNLIERDDQTGKRSALFERSPPRESRYSANDPQKGRINAAIKLRDCFFCKQIVSISRLITVIGNFDFQLAR